MIKVQDKTLHVDEDFALACAAVVKGTDTAEDIAHIRRFLEFVSGDVEGIEIAKLEEEIEGVAPDSVAVEFGPFGVVVSASELALAVGNLMTTVAVV